MTTDPVERILGEEEWIPHAIDRQAQSVVFARVPRERYSAPGFLFEFQPERQEDCIALPFSAVEGLRIDTCPVHFVFHSAFCRSTLLTRALNIDELSIGLSEPGVIASLATDPELRARLLTPLLGMLSRQRKGVRAVFIKPTNHANRIIPALLDAVPHANAILLTGSLASFLSSVRRRGLMGHRWGRQLYLENQSYAGIDFGMQPQEVFAMSDLQTAGLAWLLYQNLFAQIASKHPDRTRIVHSEQFNGARGETLAAILDFCKAGQDKPPVGALAASPAFEHHAKLGGKVTEQAVDPSTAEEIAQVEQWLKLIGQQLRLELPVPGSLL